MKLIREKELEVQAEQIRRDLLHDMVTEVFYILSRCNQQERARFNAYKSGELSKAAKIEYAKRMESAGRDWER